jgi:hypothetical protein
MKLLRKDGSLTFTTIPFLVTGSKESLNIPSFTSIQGGSLIILRLVQMKASQELFSGDGVEAIKNSPHAL